MPFTIVLDLPLNESLTEYGAILDLELKSEDHEYQTKFDTLLSDDKKNDLLAEIVDSAQYLLTKFSDRSLEPTFNLYLHILDELSSELDADLESVLGEVLEKLQIAAYSPQDSAIKPTSVISLLSNVFNFVPETCHLRVQLLGNVLKLVISYSLDNLVSPFTASLPDWLAAIDGITGLEWRELINKAFIALYERSSQVEALTFYKKLVTDERLEPRDFDRFLLRVLQAHKYFNVSDLSLESKLGDASLTQSFTILKNGDVAAFNEFITTPEGVSIAKQVGKDRFAQKVRQGALVLSLEKIEEESGSNEFTYAQISEAISAPSEQVEEFLIESIQQGLVSGRLSQVEQKFYLSKIDRLVTPSRKISANDWQRIQGYLENWSKTIDDTQALIENLQARKGKKMLPPQAIQVFHQQKQELKEQQQKERHQRQEQAEQVESTEQESSAVEAA